MEKPQYDLCQWAVEVGSLVTDLLFACSDAKAAPITLSSDGQEGLAKLLYTLTRQAHELQLIKRGQL